MRSTGLIKRLDNYIAFSVLANEINWISNSFDSTTKYNESFRCAHSFAGIQYLLDWSNKQFPIRFIDWLRRTYKRHERMKKCFIEFSWATDSMWKTFLLSKCEFFRQLPSQFVLKKKAESNRIKSPQVGSFIRYLFPWMPIILSGKKTREQKSRVHSVARWTEVDVPFNRSISLVLLAFSSLNLQVSNVQIKRITLTSMKRPRKEHIEWVFETFHP